MFYLIGCCSKLIKPMGSKSHTNFSHDVMESFYIYANFGTGSNVGRRQNIFQKWFSYGTITLFFCQLHSSVSYRTWRPLMRAKGNKKRMRRREHHVSFKTDLFKFSAVICSSCSQFLPAPLVRIERLNLCLFMYQSMPSGQWHDILLTQWFTPQKLQSEKHRKEKH